MTVTPPSVSGGGGASRLPAPTSELSSVDNRQRLGHGVSPLAVHGAGPSSSGHAPSGHAPSGHAHPHTGAPQLQPLRHQAMMSAAHLTRGGSPRVDGTPGASAPQPTLPTYHQVRVETSAQFRSSQGISFPAAAPPPASSPQPVSTESTSYSMDLPDILHSHILPQIPPARPNQHRGQRSHRQGGTSPGDTNNNTNENRDTRRGRHRSTAHGEGRHSRQRRRRSRGGGNNQSTSSTRREGTCKEPCVKCVVTVTSFRWVLVVLSVLGVCCVVTGIVLAALHAAGNSFLFLSVMFVGLGVLLVIVVAVGWKCTPRGHEPLHALFGIGNFRSGQTRERRHRRHRNRDANWYGGVMYPEFQYRRPPPSYAASMQDYQNQPPPTNPPVPPNMGRGEGDESLPNSPPPSYRSRASTVHSTITSAFPGGVDGDQPSSRPPTYRSRAPSRRPSLPRDDSDAGISPPADYSFSEPSSTVTASVGATSITVSHNPDSSEQSNQPPTFPLLISSSSSSSSTSPSSPPLSSSVTNTRSSPSITTMQVYTVPLVNTSSSNTVGVRIGSPCGSTSSDSVPPHLPHHQPLSPRDLNMTANPGSIMVQVTPPSVPPLSHQSGASTGHATAPGQSQPAPLHQRMESGDRLRLEQALQSLEDHMSEGGVGVGGGPGVVAGGGGGITNQGAVFDDDDCDYDTHL